MDGVADSGDGRWAAVRAEFPVLSHCAYLNTGTFGPLPRRCTETLCATAESELREGRLARGYDEELYDLRNRVRGALAAVVGTGREDLCLTRSTTEGLNLALAALRLGPGDQVVTSDLEHHTLPTALKCTGAQIRVARLRDAPYQEIVDRVEAACRPETKLIALSQVDWASGLVLPIPAITRLGPPVLVDGAQSAGAIPLSVTALGCAFFAFPGQKWLVGPDGIGGLYIAESLRDGLANPMPSTYGHDTQPDGTDIPFPGAVRFDAGAIGRPQLMAMAASLGLVDELGPPRLERAQALAERFCEELGARHQVIQVTERATLVSFLPPGDPDRAVAHLEDKGVRLRTVPDRGWLRVSVGYWNDETDLDRLLDGLKDLAAAR